MSDGEAGPHSHARAKLYCLTLNELRCINAASFANWHACAGLLRRDNAVDYFAAGHTTVANNYLGEKLPHLPFVSPSS